MAEEACLQLNAWNALVGELKVRATELEKQIEPSASQVRVSESKYLLIYDKTYMMRQLLVMGVSCNGETEQRLTNANKDVFGYINAVYAETEKSQNTIRESFRGVLRCMFSGYKPYPCRRSLQLLITPTTPGVRY